ncbi:MAG: MFS transporter [Bacteroidales bacterium]|nr:MFS transporter [Bacteroidales bacterium]
MMEKLWNKNYIKVMTANFSMSFSFYLLTPLLPIYLSEYFNASKDIIGTVLCGYSVMVLLIRPFSGYMVDSFNRKKVLLICLCFYFLMFAGYLAALTLTAFAIIRTLHGAPFGASTVANSTVAIDVLPSSRRNEGIGFYGLSNNIATAIAPTIGIWIYSTTGNFNILFWISFFVAGIGMWVDSTVQIPEKEIVKNKTKLSLDRFFLTNGSILAINMLCFGFCYGVLSNYLAIYGKEKLGITNSTGIYFLLLSIGLILSRLQGAKALREGKLVLNASEGIILSTFGYTIFVATDSMIGYYASAVLIGLGNGHMWPAFQNMMINLAHHNQRGTANSTLMTSWDSGVGIGILLGGFLAEHFDYQCAFWTVSGVHIVGLITFFCFTKGFFLKRKLR